uniref:Acid phosphatase n=1 Tax=Chlamydomonas leiostraca TaxID=1034604 RepID=A0A7S0RVV4_9CHLO|mmetsp:Transcript_32709/g.82990  ORF Transcript_32709/g.82990 Transcript_32709/m.82990 type:complete len:498 (+) Transcript_32709:30-1523(+)
MLLSGSKLNLPLLLVICGILQRSVYADDKLVFASPTQTLGTDDELDKGMPVGAQLQFTSVVFRDVARTPLTDRYLHKEVSWTGCSFDLSKAPELLLTAPGGTQLPPKDGADAQKHAALKGGCGMGMVTKAGYEQGVALGAWLRRRYTATHKLLPAGASQLYVRTSYHNRTMLAMRAVLAGLGGSQGAAPAASSLTLPRSVQGVASPPGSEVMYANVGRCRALGRNMRAAEKDAHTPGEGFEEEGRDAAQSVRMFLKLPEHDSHSWVSWKRLLDAIMCLEANGLPTYDGMNEVMAGVINREATQRVQTVIGPSCPPEAVPSGSQLCHGLIQLGIGPLVGALGAQVTAAAKCAEQGWGGDCASTPRLALYSGHDTSLLPLSAAFGVPLTQWPGFGASMTLELWSLPGGGDKPQLHVRLLYNGRVMDAFGKAGLMPLAGFDLGVLRRFGVASADHHKQLCNAAPGAAGGAAAAAGAGAAEEKGMGHVGHVVGAMEQRGGP